MIENHLFIFTPALWIGQGTIQLSLVKEDLIFDTKWNSTGYVEGQPIECLQQIQIQDVSEPIYNQLIFSDFTSTQFTLDFQSLALGRVLGKGFISKTQIAWEIKAAEIGFEGFEVYEKVGDAKYKMHAEYATSDELRTIIQGVIWK